MKTKLTMACLLLAVASVTSYAGDTTPKTEPNASRPAEKPAAERPAAPARVELPATGVKWTNIVPNRPCDSTACRPVRFAWAGNAPGS